MVPETKIRSQKAEISSLQNRGLDMQRGRTEAELKLATLLGVPAGELSVPVGNLRDFDWDFQKLWLSPAMQARRKKAHDGCFCTHESNSYYPSLPFNPGHLIQIKKLEREMKKARKAVEKAEHAGVPVTNLN